MSEINDNPRQKAAALSGLATNLAVPVQDRLSMADQAYELLAAEIERLDEIIAAKKIYIAIVEDRHTDAEAHPFSTAETAIDWARTYFNTNARDYVEDDDELGEQELTDDMRRGGWLYHATYTCEGDHVRVVETELDALRLARAINDRSGQ